MHPIRLSAYPYVTLAMLSLVQGCGTSARPDPQTSTKNTQDTPDEGTSSGGLSDVFAAWESGDEDGAVQLLLSIAWNEPDLRSGLPILTLTEQEVPAMSSEERTRVTQEASKFAIAARRLGQHAISIGERAQASSDNMQASLYYEAVLNLGQALGNPDGMFALKSVGNVIVNMANEKLSALD